jgi:hypothetical protein
VAAHSANRPPRSQELPKLDDFPAPSPLTAEESTLLAFAAQAAPEQKQALTKPAPEAKEPLEVEPIRIAEIEIKPLSPPDDDKQ